MVRKTFVHIAICVAIGLSANAFAGNNNNAAVNQNGVGNTATVDQTQASFSNQSVSDLYFNPGDGFTIDQQGNYNQASVTQVGVFNAGQIQQINGSSNNTASLYQNGNNLQGYAAQSATTNSDIRLWQLGSFNYGNVLELGSNSNVDHLYQGYFYGPGSNNSAYIWSVGKNGEDNFTWFSKRTAPFQIYAQNDTVIDQEQDVSDFAWIYQYGGDVNTSAVVFQSLGSFNSAEIFQAGVNNSLATIEQHGVSGIAASQQYNGTAESHILQYGVGNQAYTYQVDGAPGIENLATIDQGDTNGLASNNYASIVQSGFANTALITQEGNSNVGTITQAGFGNNAAVHQ